MIWLSLLLIVYEEGCTICSYIYLNALLFSLKSPWKLLFYSYIFFFFCFMPYVLSLLYFLLPYFNCLLPLVLCLISRVFYILSFTLVLCLCLFSFISHLFSLVFYLMSYVCLFFYFELFAYLSSLLLYSWNFLGLQLFHSCPLYFLRLIFLYSE